MSQSKLERCRFACCYFVDGKAVTREQYDAAKTGHPANYAGVAPGRRNAILEHMISCRNVAKQIPDHSIRIRKGEGDVYLFAMKDGLRWIDDEIDGPKLMATLGREALLDDQGATVTPADVLSALDAQQVGFELLVRVSDRAA